MSVRVDTTPLIASSLIVGDTGLGVDGSEVPSTGTHGPGYIYDQVSGTYDANEVIGQITQAPASGDFMAYEDSSFTLLNAADGSHEVRHQLYVDGVLTGAEQIWFISIGVSTVEVSASFAIDLGASDSGLATAEGGTTSPIELNDSATGQFTIEAMIAVGIDLGQTAPAQADAEASSAHAVNIGTTATGTVDAVGQIEAAISLSTSLGAIATADADALADAVFGASLGFIATAEIVAAGSIQASIALSAELATQMSAEADAADGIFVGAELATQMIAEVAAEAGIAVGVIQGVTFTGTAISGQLVTPDNRRFVIAAEIRTFKVLK